MRILLLSFSLSVFIGFWNPKTLKAQSPTETAPLSPLEKRYQEILEEEREQLRKGEFIEDLASGLAALTIGLYGYYNDNRGISSKLIYSATQTAGVLFISQTIRRADQPSLLLSLDRSLRRHDTIDLESYKRLVVRVDDKLTRSNQKQLAYTSLILGSIYGYNAFREKDIAALRSVFGFLSFNFFVVSGVNFFKLSQAPELFSKEPQRMSSLSLFGERDLIGIQWNASI